MRFRNPTVILSNNNERRILNQNRTETQGEGDKMKKLYLINGTMGVGKTTIGQILKKKLNKSVFLDGDWCWDSHPFQVTDETKAMVIDNICYLLNNFLRCTAYENIVFCWVMDRQEIIDTVLNRLDTENVDVKIVSLVCSEEALTRRIDKDVRAGLRRVSSIENSISRLSSYYALDSIKIDTTAKTPEEVAEMVLRL